MTEYQGNSYKSKEIANEKQKVRVVTQGRVKKKSIGQKAADIFLKQDLDTVVKYVIEEKLIPGIVNELVDLFETTIEMIFLDGARPRSGKSSGRKTNEQTSYRAFYKSDSSGKSDYYDSTPGRYPMVPVEVDYKDEAREIFDVLGERIQDYGECCVGDLYDAAGITHDNFNDRNWGWKSMKGFGTRLQRNGKFLIVTPKPEPI